MEVDEIQRQVSKFQKVSSNGSSTTTTDNSTNPQKLATKIGNFELHDNNNNNHVDDHGGGGGVARLYGWPSSRIVRVSRASGGKDRHSKVLTSKGLRDRRVRLSVGTAIQFYDLQDRLGYDQPSKAVEWLLKAAASSIDELPSLDLPIGGHYHQIRSPKKIMGNGNEVEDVNNYNHNRNHLHENKNNNSVDDGNDNNNGSQAKSPAYSSTSETSKGSDLSLSRAENRIKARERARDLASKKEKEKEIDSTRVSMLMNQVNNNISPDNSSFTDLLTGGINTTIAVRSPIEYFFNRSQQTPPQLFQLPQFNITTTGENNNNLQHFSFFQQQQQDNINNNFSMTSPSSSSVAPGGYTRGTLQSNLQSSILPHHYHHHHLQRFQQSAMDGSAAAAPTNLPIFIVPNSGSVDHFPTMGGYHFGYGGVGDHQKDKGKN